MNCACGKEGRYPITLKVAGHYIATRCCSACLPAWEDRKPMVEISLRQRENQDLRRYIQRYAS